MIIIYKLLNPKIDYVFKRIFGYIGNEDITKDLLQAILNRNITSLNLDNNTILEKEIFDEKMGILDIKAKIDNVINCNIEVQVIDKGNIEKRLLFYWSKIYSKTIKKGEDYSKLEKTIVILFAEYELKDLKNVEKYMTKWNIREEEYNQIILTEDLEIIIIEMPKYLKYKDKVKNNDLDIWLKFINNPEVIDMENNNEKVVKAKKILEEISQDEHEQYIAELREKYIRDQKSIRGLGYEEGKEEGKKEEKIKIAKKLLEENVSIEIISKTTGLTEQEINELK